MSFINKFIGTTSLQPVDTKIYDEALVLFNNAKAQNELLDGHLKSTVVQGSDVDVLPEAVGRFGFDKTSPVPVNGLFGAWSYVSRLRSLTTGGPVYFHLNEIKDGAACFEVINRSGRQAFYLWFDLYHPRQSRDVPEGYILEREAVFPRGITYHDDGFPKDLYKKIRKEAKKRLHLEVFDKEAQYIDTEEASRSLEALREKR